MPPRAASSWESDVGEEEKEPDRAWESTSEEDVGDGGGETGVRPPPAPHPPSPPPDESDSEAEPELTAGAALVNNLVDLYVSRALTAKDLCVLCWHAKNAGIAEAAPHAFRPNAASSGHYQRHLDKSLPFMKDVECLYEFDVAAHTDAVGRGKHAMVMIPPHEAMAEQMEDGSVQAALQQKIAEGGLPDAYHAHPKVQGQEEPPVPVSIFVDGVPYSNEDSILGFWLINEITNERSLLGVVRKALMCTCGCRGWDTLHAVLMFLAWSFLAMLQGHHPAHRHDGGEWTRIGDALRRDQADKPLGWRAVLLFIKGDWVEFSSCLGLPTWQDQLRPCLLCNAEPERMHVTTRISPDALPWRANRIGDHEAACKRCEVWVAVSDTESRDALLSKMRYDKRERGHRGRCLVGLVPEFPTLKKGDRLEPGLGLADVGDLEHRTDFPMRLCFWRTSRESLARRRCPLLSPTLGTDPSTSIALDILHVVYLGVMQAWTCAAIWGLINGGTWGHYETQDTTVANACAMIRHELRQFYVQRHQANPHEGLTRVGKFKRRHLMSPEDKKLRTKGAQTWGVMLWLLQRMQQAFSGGRLDETMLRIFRAGLALHDLVMVWNTSGAVLTPEQVNHTYDAWNRYLSFVGDMDKLITPKRHMVTHVIARSAKQGNPRRYANWMDESLNRDLKLACRQLSQATFEKSVLLRMKYILRNKMSRLKRPRDAGAT